MITLTFIILTWFIISIIRINRACKKINMPFQPLMLHDGGKLVDFAGFFVGIVTIIAVIVFMCIFYLP
jgi:hypothetical protein